MTLKPRDQASVRRWKGAFIASLFAASALLWPSLNRFGDGDASYAYYDAGLRSWSEVLSLTFLPPGVAVATPTPVMGSGVIATSPVYVFGRWRPFSQLLYVKALWALGLSPVGYRILSWVTCWLTALAMAWGVVGAYSLSGPLPPEALWALATLLFWSVPTLFASTIPFFTVNVASALFGLAAGFFCRVYRGDKKRSNRPLELALAAFFGFLACQSHENSWWLLLWLGGYLGVLRYFDKSKIEAPGFWWPWLLIAAHVLIFRSLTPPTGPNWTGGGSENYSFAPAMLWTRFSYFMLVPLNGLFDPLVAWLGADIFRLDIAAQPWPFALLLTLFSVGWIARSRTSLLATSGASKESGVHWAFGMTIGVGALTVLPYCIVLNLRFIYYAKLFADLLAIGVFMYWVRKPRPRAQMLVPWIAANVLTVGYTAAHTSWLDWNAADSSQYMASVVRLYPELGKCNPEHPCCVSDPLRIWGRNEWVLSYNLGAASSYPSFYPEEWPGVHCEQHFKLNGAL